MGAAQKSTAAGLPLQGPHQLEMHELSQQLTRRNEWKEETLMHAGGGTVLYRDYEAEEGLQRGRS